MHVIPGSPPGLPGGWYNAVFYGLQIAYVLHAAHIPADDLPPIRLHRGGRP